jgi:hypothetical protein
MGEALLYTAFTVVVVTVVGAFLARMAAQILKDAGREKKVTECIASLNMLMVHIDMYAANTSKTEDQRRVINAMIEAWNQRYSHWRGYQKIPNLT